MKGYETEDLSRLGMRLKSARALTGLSQSEFCEKHKLSIGAFKTWESGKFAPRTSNLQELCSCLESEGVFNATPAWFLKGEGPAPTHMRTETISENYLNNHANPRHIEEEIKLFKRNQLDQSREPIVAVIADDLMFPYFAVGDIVGGVKLNKSPPLSEIAKKPFLIETKPEHYLVRRCLSDGENLYFKHENDSLIQGLNDHRLGEILWHRRFK